MKNHLKILLGSVTLIAFNSCAKTAIVSSDFKSCVTELSSIEHEARYPYTGKKLSKGRYRLVHNMKLSYIQTDITLKSVSDTKTKISVRKEFKTFGPLYVFFMKELFRYDEQASLHIIKLFRKSLDNDEQDLLNVMKEDGVFSPIWEEHNKSKQPNH